MPSAPIPMSQWGKDHWSTFAYIETRITDHKGVPNKQHMRCDPKLHPAHAHEGSHMGPPAPTRLRDGELPNHDDWSCLEDAEAAGLLTNNGTGMFPVYVLTDKGGEVTDALRKHKRQGGSFGNFRYPAHS